ncbi:MULTISPECIES: hypothetical protein [Actinokineospora]|uniref:hypothetical protein n=1 Tax=Actinokineospora TaxID=39845 RepID=UPI0016711CCF|nr:MULTISPECIES: hypothetical protein [Actinokineospora]UVS77697.1 hypothetical protein Actkin_01416 [Actinokineospora sp. UTMC 2448]
MQGLTDWWDDVELWLATIPFALQFTLVMAVLLPLCLGLAWLIDRAVDYTSARFGSRHEPPIDAE